MSRFRKMENFLGVERHELTHRAQFVEKEATGDGSPIKKKQKTSE